MARKVYISASQDETNREHLKVIKDTFYYMSDNALSAISADDLPDDGGDLLSRAKKAIDTCDLFLGLYGENYGTVAAGQSKSFEEQEYEFAHHQGKMCLIFVPEEARHTPDERQQAFLAFLSQTHVINYYADNDALAAKLKMALDNYRRNERKQLLRPPDMSFLGKRPDLPEAPRAKRSETESTISDDSLEDVVGRALVLAEEELEQIVRHSLEMHDAQNRIASPSSDNDGLLTVSPIFGEPSRRSQFNADIFMIMPFRERFNQVYESVIRSSVANLNLTMKRGDEFSSVRGSIMQDVWAALNSCRLVIVETTEINANVYYELGIAHTLGKPAVLLTQTTEVDELPFDLRHLRFIVYEDSETGLQQLDMDLRQSIIWLLNDLDEQSANMAQ